MSASLAWFKPKAVCATTVASNKAATFRRVIGWRQCETRSRKGQRKLEKRSKESERAANPTCVCLLALETEESGGWRCGNFGARRRISIPSGLERREPVEAMEVVNDDGGEGKEDEVEEAERHFAPP